MDARGASTPATAPALPAAPASAWSNWREGLPVLSASTIALREVEMHDAPSLVTMLSTADVTRFISAPPDTLDAMERFIASAQEARKRGNYLCYGVVPHGMSEAVGVFELHRIDQAFGVAEWKFALGSAYWGTGMFLAAARMTVDFAMSALGVHRLEIRVAAQNARGHAAMRKLGATRECVLRRAFTRNHRYLDQIMWSIIDTDWVRARALCGPKVRVH